MTVEELRQTRESCEHLSYDDSEIERMRCLTYIFDPMLPASVSEVCCFSPYGFMLKVFYRAINGNSKVISIDDLVHGLAIIMRGSPELKSKCLCLLRSDSLDPLWFVLYSSVI